MANLIITGQGVFEVLSSKRDIRVRFSLLLILLLLLLGNRDRGKGTTYVLKEY